MKPSQIFFSLVMAFEGCKLIAYQDIAGIWTIGFGTTHYPDGTPVAEGDTCTTSQAMDWLTQHLTAILLPAGLTQPQFDACMDFCYNAGLVAFNNSTLKKDILAGADADTITDDFLMWDKAHVDGNLVEVPGLLRRRRCEAYLFNNGVNAPNFLA